jgi:hypothetical protein
MDSRIQFTKLLDHLDRHLAPAVTYKLHLEPPCPLGSITVRASHTFAYRNKNAPHKHNSGFQGLEYKPNTERLLPSELHWLADHGHEVAMSHLLSRSIAQWSGSAGNPVIAVYEEH